MSDSRADIIPNAEMKPSSATEKLARLQLMEKQLTFQKSTDPQEKALLGNFSEVEAIRMDILLAIADYKESTPEWYQLKALTGGLEDPFDQADYLAKTIYEAQKMDLMMSYYTPSKTAIREKFVANAKKGNDKRSAVLKSVEDKMAAKKSIIAAALTGRPRDPLASGGAGS